MCNETAPGTLTVRSRASYAYHVRTGVRTTDEFPGPVDHELWELVSWYPHAMLTYGIPGLRKQFFF